MAINYPESCRNVTAGALRQVKAQGFTTASGGLFSTDAVRRQVVSDYTGFFRKNEPLGDYMIDLEKTAADVAKLTDTIQARNKQMVEQASEGGKAIAKVSGSLRASADNLATAIEKFGKIANNTQFAETARNAESLVASLERLAELQKSGMLEKVMSAMKG